MAPGKRTRSEGVGDSKFSLKSRPTPAKGKKGAKSSMVNSNLTKEKIGITARRVFPYDFFKDFFKKNPNVSKDEVSVDAVFEAAGNKWKLLSDADKAPYVSRSLMLRKHHIKATSVTVAAPEIRWRASWGT